MGIEEYRRAQAEQKQKEHQQIVALERVRHGVLTEMQMGLLTTIEKHPGEIPINLTLGYSGSMIKQVQEAFVPLFMGGLLYMTATKTLELSDEGQAILNKAREAPVTD
jgi:hypothetical protein